MKPATNDDLRLTAQGTEAIARIQSEESGWMLHALDLALDITLDDVGRVKLTDLERFHLAGELRDIRHIISHIARKETTHE